MSLSCNGSTQYVSAATSPVTAYPLTMVARFNPDILTQPLYTVSIENSVSAALNGWRMRCAGETAGDPVRFATGSNGPISGVNSSAFVVSTWQTMYFVCTSNILRQGYRDNANLTTDAVDITPTGIDRILVGASGLIAVISGFFDGLLSDIGIYNRVLTATERAMYNAGLTANNVAKDALVVHLPFFTNIDDYAGVTAWTNNGSATFAADPPLKFVNNGMMMGMM